LTRALWHAQVAVWKTKSVKLQGFIGAAAPG
jgi:hypothetical protein